MRNDKAIEGITINLVENKLSQFADDMDLYLLYKKEVLEAAINALTKYANNTGLRVNYDKSVMHKIGSACKSNAKFYTSKKFQWSDEDMNVLGVIINSQEHVVTKNFNPVIQKINNIFEAWKPRQISLMGKILIANQLVGSLLVCKMMVLPRIDEKFIEEIELSINQFLWGDTRAKIPLQILTQPKDAGDLIPTYGFTIN